MTFNWKKVALRSGLPVVRRQLSRRSSWGSRFSLLPSTLHFGHAPVPWKSSRTLSNPVQKPVRISYLLSLFSTVYYSLVCILLLVFLLPLPTALPPQGSLRAPSFEPLIPWRCRRKPESITSPRTELRAGVKDSDARRAQTSVSAASASSPRPGLSLSRPGWLGAAIFQEKPKLRFSYKPP